MDLPNSNWDRVQAKLATPYLIPKRFGSLRWWFDETPVSLATAVLLTALLVLGAVLFSMYVPLLGGVKFEGNPDVKVERVVLGRGTGAGPASDLPEGGVQHSRVEGPAAAAAAEAIEQVDVQETAGSIPDPKADRKPAVRRNVGDLNETVSKLDQREQDRQAAADAATNAARPGRPATGRPGLPGLQGLGRVFKVEGSVKRVVYVVDKSSSMTGPPLEVVKEELIHGIKSLKEDQAFAVIFYDDFAWPMLARQGQVVTADPGADVTLIKATPANKVRAEQWIRQMQAENGTNPVPAMSLAIDARPDLIMLLSDGEFAPSAVFDITRLNQAKRREKPRIDCVGLADDIETLKEIAGRNRGKYFAASLK